MDEMQPKKMQETRSGRPVVDRERRIYIGHTIRKYRIKAGLDQASLAAKVGFSTSAVGNWEHGLSRPDVDTLPRVCEILHIPITELLGLPIETALAAEDRSLLDMYHRLNKYNRHTVLQLTDRLLFQQDGCEMARLRDTYGDWSFMRKLPRQVSVFLCRRTPGRARCLSRKTRYQMLRMPLYMSKVPVWSPPIPAAVMCMSA
ncbi:MAG: helix-turn-helix transcriptional regulator [Clostridia bacterium]|nr:helix-turn-helix transcriptional regulator [Clostridia bacterium]